MPPSTWVKQTFFSFFFFLWFYSYLLLQKEIRSVIKIFFKIQNAKAAVQPIQLEPLVRHMVQTLPDLSVTRDRDRLSWGIPVPGDETQTVWQS